jgi:Tol biopolymer transport system component
MARLAPALAFSEAVVNINVWRVAAWPGAERKPQRWITSTGREASPAVSPDGSHIAVSSARSGSSQIWLTDASGSSPRRITALAGLTVGSPRWSPDGTQIAYDARVKSNPDIWVSPAAGGEPRQLTTADSEDIVPDWSPDGSWKTVSTAWMPTRLRSSDSCRHPVKLSSIASEPGSGRISDSSRLSLRFRTESACPRTASGSTTRRSTSVAPTSCW